MIGSDVVVAYYDERSGRFHADDYYISGSSQCDGVRGVCKDEIIRGRNDVKLIHGERRHGITTIIYERPQHTNEPINDKPIMLNDRTNVIAAIGPLNLRNEPTTHATADKSTGNSSITRCKFFDISDSKTIIDYCRDFGAIRKLLASRFELARAIFEVMQIHESKYEIRA